MSRAPLSPTLPQPQDTVMEPTDLPVAVPDMAVASALWPVRQCTNDNSLKAQHHQHHSAVDLSVSQSMVGSSTSMLALSKHADHAIAPFYAQHVPSQYNPVGFAQDPERGPQIAPVPGSDNTKYCNRHRPDLKCRRQANEPSMDELQAELSDMSHSDQQAITQIWSIFSAAPSKHRNMILRGLLTQCCFPQLSFLSNQVRDLVKIDFISALPAELGYKILCYLDTASLCKAAQVCRKWRILADDDIVWHRMCEQHIDRKCTKCGWGLPLLDKRRLRLEKTIMMLKAKGIRPPSPTDPNAPITSPSALPLILPTLSAAAAAAATVAAIPTSTTLSPPPSSISVHVANCANESATTIDKDTLPIHDDLTELDLATRKRARPSSGEGNSAHGKRPRPGARPWKEVYKDRFKIGTNWKYGRCNIKTFKGHSNGVMCLQFDDAHLATGSYDATIKIWDIESGKLIRTLKGHTSGVRCLQFDSTTLMSGSLDGTLRLWNWRKGTCTKVLDAHRKGVITLHYTSKMIATGSIDRTIKVFDMRKDPTPVTFRLRGHVDWVNAVKIDQDSATLFSCSDDFTVRLWDLETRSCIRCFEGHVGQVQQVLPMPREFEPFNEGDHGSQDKEKVSSGASSPVPTHTTYGTTYPNDNIPYDQSMVPQLWKDSSERKAPPRYMITGALDNTIRLWDVHGDCKMVPVPIPPTNPDDPNARCEPHIPTVFHHVRTFFGHVEGIWSLAVDHLRLVSGSEDRMVKVWDPRTGKCERTWTGHAGPVTCVGISDSRLVSGSEDCEVRMLDFGYNEDSKKSQRSGAVKIPCGEMSQCPEETPVATTVATN